MYYFIICIIFIVAFVFITSRMNKKKQREAEERNSKLAYGVKITAANGLIGTVTEVLELTVKVDFSPDQSGSIVEIAKEAVTKVHD